MPTRSADAIELLITDHRKVRQLLTALENTTGRATSRRETLLQQIDKEIQLHTRLEEEIFYPAYKDAAHKSDQHLYYEAIEEHHLVDAVLREIKSADVASAEFGAKAKVLRDLIEHHAGEEEGQMFPKARKLLGVVQLRHLGKRIQDRRTELQIGVLARAGRSTRVVGW
jgi:hemerythrin superfamily protein